MAKNTNSTISYSNLMNQISALTKQAEAVRKQEASNVVASIRQQMQQFGLTAKDLLGGNSTSKIAKNASRGKASNVTATKAVTKTSAKKTANKSSAKQISAVETTNAATVRKNKFSPRRKPEPKYMNPETGQTWTGRGKTPTWLQGRRKSRFAITNTATA